jgi:hypothetical protein
MRRYRARGAGSASGSSRSRRLHETTTRNARALVADEIGSKTQGWSLGMGWAEARLVYRKQIGERLLINLL